MQLSLYVSTVGLDRLDTDPKGRRCLARPESLAEQIEDGQFTVAELFDRRAGGKRLAFNELRRDSLCHSVAEIEFALRQQNVWVNSSGSGSFPNV
jgi:hypothetical protein